MIFATIFFRFPQISIDLWPLYISDVKGTVCSVQWFNNVEMKPKKKLNRINPLGIDIRECIIISVLQCRCHYYKRNCVMCSVDYKDPTKLVLTVWIKSSSQPFCSFRVYFSNFFGHIYISPVALTLQSCCVFSRENICNERGKLRRISWGPSQKSSFCFPHSKVPFIFSPKIRHFAEWSFL